MGLLPLPNGRRFLDHLGVSADHLRSQEQLTVSAQSLTVILQAVISTLPFDKGFYLATYEDIAKAHRSGKIPDPHRHFIEQGYFEGRLGADPQVDEGFYRITYPDIAQAIARGAVRSGRDHFINAGAAEGRFPNRQQKESWETWGRLLARV